MLLETIGVHLSQASIHNAGFTIVEQMPLINTFFVAKIGKPNLTAIKAQIDRGLPVPLLLNIETGKHKVLAVGYDNDGRELITHDPDRGANYRYPMTDLLEADGAVFIDRARLWFPGKVAGMLNLMKNK